MKKKENTREYLMEVMSKLDPTFKPRLNEMYDGDPFDMPNKQPSNNGIPSGEPRTLSQIAREIRRDWGNVNYAAKPYLDAMSSLNSVNDKYGYDDAKSIVLYFLSNASSYRGENAKRIKAELKKMVGLKEEIEPE